MTRRQHTAEEVPAFLCVDVEPDTNGIPEGERATWSGYDAVDEQCAWLRAELERRTGACPRFSWFIRMDPQIAVVAPRADHAVSGYRDRIARLRAAGDGFGVHVHPFRWSDEHGGWIDDYLDSAWGRSCIEHSVQSFAGAFGSPPDRHRFGGGSFHPEHVALLERLGVRFDFTMERRALIASKHTYPVEEAPDNGRVGALLDCTSAPAMAYRPAQHDSLQADDRHGRNVVIVPLSAKRGRGPHTRVHRVKALLARRGRPAHWRVLYPVPRPSQDPRDYWDEVASSLDAMARPYVAIAVRTNPPDSPAGVGARRTLEALPDHSLANRLRFVDPLDAVPRLLTRRARTGLSWSRAGSVEVVPR